MPSRYQSDRERHWNYHLLGKKPLVEGDRVYWPRMLGDKKDKKRWGTVTKVYDAPKHKGSHRDPRTVSYVIQDAKGYLSVFGQTPPQRDCLIWCDEGFSILYREDEVFWEGAFYCPERWEDN